ncbi:class I SAM-dependent methyltransferase [Dyella sp. Tek66A03]|uniref:class I SAM-dependent methyltransferase n=1 Tax=Dyella sp. Tek66A03 TaxID=3458298 RepID=UPI00403ED330
MQLDDRHHRPCPICHRFPAHAKIFLEERIDPEKLNEFSFSSRKEPEHLCYQMVRCPDCDLVYVDRPPSQGALANAYHTADYDSSEEANDAASSYIRAFTPALLRIHKGSALEIGTGTGIFLEELTRFGFGAVAGVEPSTAAIAAAPAHRRAWIREGIFVGEDFPAASFDLICCFMTLEHVRDPLDIAESAYRLLKPGGAFLTVTHDYRSSVNRLLGGRSPIIDIEHMQLFSGRSVSALLERAGYVQVEAAPFTNRYSLRYWNRLMPFPASVKKSFNAILSAVGLAQMKLSLNVGNSAAVGFKPDGQ